jgi:hypothetical protein
MSPKACHDSRLSTLENTHWLQGLGVCRAAALQPVDALRLPELVPARNACHLRPCLSVFVRRTEPLTMLYIIITLDQHGAGFEA